MALWKKKDEAPDSADAQPAVFEPFEQPDKAAATAGGPVEEVHVRIVREWHPQAPETLPEIEAAIDSWGGTYRSTEAVRSRPAVDLRTLSTKVDRVTRRVKGSRKVVVQETATEWVEGPMGSGPVAVEEEPEPAEEHVATGNGRPRRRFLGFGRKKDKAERKGDEDGDYQPQCSALTDDGAQCRNSARHGSKYCSSHKGYQPPTAKGLAQRIEGDAWDPSDGLSDRASVATADTKPRVRKAKDTKVKVRKARKGRR